MRGSRGGSVAAVLAVLVVAGAGAAVLSGDAGGTSPVPRTHVDVVLEGHTAANLTVTGEPSAVADSVARTLGVRASAVRVRTGVDADRIEVRAAVERAAVRRALDRARVNATGASIGPNVTARTQRRVGETVRNRLQGVAGTTTVRTETVEGRRGLRIVGERLTPSTVLQSGLGRRPLELRLTRPSSESSRSVTRVAGVHRVTVPQRNGARTLVLDLSDRALSSLRAVYADERLPDVNDTACRYNSSPDAPGYCLLGAIDGRVVAWTAPNTSHLAAVRRGDRLEPRSITVTVRNDSDRTALARRLGHGNLSAPVRIADVRIETVDPRPVTRPPRTTATTGTAATTPTATGIGGSGFGLLSATAALVGGCGWLLARQSWPGRP